MFKQVQLLSERQKGIVKDFLSSYILKNDLKQKLAQRKMDKLKAITIIEAPVNGTDPLK